jgi:radical SAM superfamily enzyme YgiQ (UPF0313 family)
MKILLIKPNQESNEIIPPLGLGFIADSVRKEHDVEVMDCILLNLSTKEFEKKIENMHVDIFGIQTFSSDVYIVQNYVDIIRAAHPDSIIILGGPHPTVWKKKILKNFIKVDFAFAGESEIGFPQLVNLIDRIPLGNLYNATNSHNLQDINGLIYRQEDKIMINETTNISNLDEFFPAYDLLHLEKYPIAPHGGYFKQKPTAPILITRGCPNQCDFCSGPIISGIKIRHHSIKYILNLLKMLKTKFGIREFHIEDDNFSFDREYAKKFCLALIESNLGFTWTAANGIRLDTLDDELLSLMVKSGMYSISLGIESGSDRILKKMKKRITVKTIIQKIRLIKQFDIDIIGFFIIGYPGETVDEIKRTIDFACKLPLKRANFSTFKPLPGTNAFNNLLKTKQITKIAWNKLTLHSVAWASKEIGVKKLEKLRKQALWKFYIRPQIFFSIFKEIRNIQHFKMVILRIYRLLIRMKKS